MELVNVPVLPGGVPTTQLRPDVPPNGGRRSTLFFNEIQFIIEEIFPIIAVVLSVIYQIVIDYCLPVDWEVLSFYLLVF